MASLICSINFSASKLRMPRHLMQLRRNFNNRPIEMYAKNDEPKLSPIFKLPGANALDVKTMLTKRTADELSTYLHVDINAPVQEALQQLTRNRARALLVL